jgi:hypothetical protein
MTASLTLQVLGGDFMDHRSDSTFFLMVVILITGGLFAPIVGFGFNLATDDVLFVSVRAI